MVIAALIKPFFDYEMILSDIPHEHKHVWIKKATGLGITEFMLRHMAWHCLRNDDLKGTQMCIVTGPRIDLAITLIDRMERLFTDNELLTFDSKETVIELNGDKSIVGRDVAYLRQQAKGNIARYLDERDFHLFPEQSITLSTFLLQYGLGVDSLLRHREIIMSRFVYKTSIQPIL